tara:strand:+ start:5155 stop:5715 length:561 start_codon:yes stop_codon:yes gene_type:complete
MSNCNLNTGYVLGCAITGGIKNVYLGEFDAAQVFTPDANNVITTFTQNPNPATGNVPGVFNMGQDTEYAGVEGAGTHSIENGTVFYETKVTLRFAGLSNELREVLMQLGKAPLYAVIESDNGEFYVLGNEKAGRASSSTATLGKAMGDFNGVDLEITFKSKDPIQLIDSALLVPVASATATDIPVN